MSTWLARSLANSLLLDGDGNNENDIVTESPTTSPKNYHQDNALGSQFEQEEEKRHHHDETQGRGVKEDLDEIKQTLTRQFWGMASFLAPPPTISQSDHSVSQSDSEQQEQVDDVVISNQSFDVEQIALHGDDPEPNSVSIGSESEGDREPEFDFQCAVGITEEVLTFAMNIAMHPETWLDFPIDEEDDTEGSNLLRSTLQFINYSCPLQSLDLILVISLLN